MPEIKEFDVDLNNYDTIIIGTPVWWYAFAPTIKTFLNNHDFSGKNIYPYATNGAGLAIHLKILRKNVGRRRFMQG